MLRLCRRRRTPSSLRWTASAKTVCNWTPSMAGLCSAKRCHWIFRRLAKGFAVDRIAEMLQQQGIDRFMVEVGGEIRLSGLSARGRPMANRD